VLKGDRNHLDDPLAHAPAGQDREENPGGEHGGQGRLPTDLPLAGHHHGEGEVGVVAHGRRNADGIIRPERHEKGGQETRQARGGHDRAEVHPGSLEHGRLDRDDIRHGHEGGDAPDDL